MTDRRGDGMERALERDWERVLREGTASASEDGVDPGLAAIVRRLHDEDPAPAADPIFAGRLWHELSSANASRRPPPVSPEATAQATPNGRTPLVMLERTPATTPGRTGSPRSGRQSWWPMVELAAVAAMVVALVGGFVLLAHRPVRPTESTLAPVAPAEVPMFRGGPARTGELLGPGPIGSPVARWSADLGAGNVAASSPAVTDGLVVVGIGRPDAAGGGVRAFDAAGGDERWRFEAGPVISSPAVAGGAVYVGSLDGSLYALDAVTGEERWRRDLGAPVYESSPVVIDGTVYIQSGGTASSPAVVDGVVYVGGGLAADGAEMPGEPILLALDASTGEPRWRFSARAAGLHALDAATGEALWRFPTAAGVDNSAPAVADGVVYFRGLDLDSGGGVLYAVDVATRQPRWRFRSEAGLAGSPAVAAGTVIVGGFDGRVLALDAASGDLRWEFAAGDSVRSAPVVSAGVIYVGSDDRHVYALDAASGAERWRFPVAGAVVGSPAVTAGVVYVGSGACADCGDGVVYALGDDTGALAPGKEGAG